jgi:SNF2 family DNA or RNA helicase
LGLSGTIIKNKLPDLWVPLAICSQCQENTNGLKLTGELQKYYQFCRYFCNIETIKIRDRRIEKFGGIKDEKIPEIKALLKDKYIRFNLADVFKDMPEIIEKDVYIELKEVPGLKEQYENYMAGSKVDPTAKSMSALLKVPATLEYLESFIESGESAVIFTDHIASAKELGEKLKCPYVTGQTDSAKRSSLVDEFQAGKFQFLVATIGSLSVGVTLTRANHVVFNDISWGNSDNMQARSRIHRIGQTKTCFAHYILGSETDAYMKRTVEAKARTVFRVLGHD